MFPLKLKLNTNTKSIAPSGASTPQTPLATPGGTPRLKIKLNAKSTPSSPAPQSAPSQAPFQASPPPPAVGSLEQKKSKAGRVTKPTAKILDRKRNIQNEDDSDDEGTISVQQPIQKKLKLSMSHTNGPPGPMSAALKTPGTVILKTKVKGKIPPRPPGVGYDSEASDREVDPAIEEQFVMRMMPGPDCEYLQWAVANKKFGIPKSQGGAEVYMRFFNENGRRGIMKIRDKIYATTLVDLPCIVEGMKSWDKRGWWKSADICQLLLIFALIEKEEDAKTIDLPEDVDPVTFQYPHGLTAPMHFARKRVFRKRVSKSTIEAVEEEVERLLRADATAIASRFEMMDPERHGSQFSPQGSEFGEDEVYSGNEDAEGEEDDQDGYFASHEVVHDEAHAEDLAAELEADLEADLEAEMMGADQTPASTIDAPSFPTGTPLTLEDQGEEDGEEYDSGDESIEEEDATAEVDVEAQNREKVEEGIREDIREMERQLVQAQENLARQSNVLLRKRMEESIRKIKMELQLKKASIDEDDEEA